MIIPERIGSKYRFIVLVGQRVAQLQKGALPKIDVTKNMKLTEIATQELLEGKIEFRNKDDIQEDQPHENAELVP